MKSSERRGHTGCLKYIWIMRAHWEDSIRPVMTFKAKVRLSEEMYSRYESLCVCVCVCVVISWPYCWALWLVCQSSWQMGGQAERWQWCPGSVLEQCCPPLAPRWTHSAHCSFEFLWIKDTQYCDPITAVRNNENKPYLCFTELVIKPPV